MRLVGLIHMFVSCVKQVNFSADEIRQVSIKKFDIRSRDEKSSKDDGKEATNNTEVAKGYNANILLPLDDNILGEKY